MSAEWKAIVAAAQSGRLEVPAIADLALWLGRSGANLPARQRPTADLASTGGPTSLSTVLCPPMLAARGWDVPKLGVPGRPAGGVDVLSGIDGYRVALDLDSAERVLSSCHYVHLEAGSTFAPADAELFRYRQSVGAQSIPDLAIASLLSKKVAMGVHRVGLEVRVAPHGNFGSNLAEARDAAERFCAVGHALSLDPICILTDATAPFQPFVGRGEALLALDLILDGKAPGWLKDHLEDCGRMASIVGGVKGGASDMSRFNEIALANIIAQGGSREALRCRARAVEAGHTYVVDVASEGTAEFNLEAIRTAVMGAQGLGPGKWPDAAGVILRVRPGEPVRYGTAVMTARCEPRAWPAFRTALAAAVRTGHSEQRTRSAILEVVGV